MCALPPYVGFIVFISRKKGSFLFSIHFNKILCVRYKSVFRIKVSYLIIFKFFFYFFTFLILSDRQFQGLSKMVLLFAPKFPSQKLWPITWEGVWRPAGRFLYKLIGQKMAQKWPKMAIFGQKCFKWPKIWLFDVFRYFLLIFVNFTNFRRKLADFWPKKRHFFADSAKISKNFEKNISTEN